MTTNVLVPLRPYQVYRLQRPPRRYGVLARLRHFWHRHAAASARPAPHA